MKRDSGESEGRDVSEEEGKDGPKQACSTSFMCLHVRLSACERPSSIIPGGNGLFPGISQKPMINMLTCCSTYEQTRGRGIPV